MRTLNNQYGGGTQFPPPFVLSAKGRLSTALFLAAAAAFCAWMHLPPNPFSTDAPPDAFSAHRAIRHIETFAQAPHAAGTASSEEVADYILAALDEIGAETRVAEGMVVGPHGGGWVRNVLGRLSGTDHSKAFMLVTHYDSVPWGPGAADDGAGVAAMLEACRALKAGPPLKNDVVFLFTDAEEVGLLGAQFFRDDDEWADDIGLVLNFEARGTRGPSYLFETSERNGWLVPEIAKAGCNPRMSSVMFDMYIRMPTTTDFKELKKAIPGMGVAFIGNLPYYHTANDRPENVNLASLQHHGTYAVALARHFGCMDLTDVPRERDAVYSSLPGGFVVHYAGRWAWPVALFVGVLFVVVCITGLALQRLTLGGIMAGMACMLLACLGAALVCAVGVAVAYYARGLYLLYMQPWYFAAFLAWAGGVYFLLVARFRRRWANEDLSVGAAAWWLVAVIATTVLLPSSSFLAVWPLGFALAGLLLLIAMPGRSFVAIVGLFLALPGFAVIVPHLYATYEATTVFFACAYIPLAVLGMGLLVPFIESAAYPRLGGTALCALLFGTALYAIGLAFGGPSEVHPRFNFVSYAMDADTGKAWWLTSDQTPDAWTKQFLGNTPERKSAGDFGYHGAYLMAEAEPAGLPGPDVHVLDDEILDGQRRLNLLFTSPRCAPRLTVMSHASENATIVAAQGKPCRPAARHHLYFDCMDMPPQGLELTVRCAPEEEVVLRVVDCSYELPVVPGMAISPRPPHIVPQPNTVNFNHGLQSDWTLVARSVTIPPRAPPPQPTEAASR